MIERTLYQVPQIDEERSADENGDALPNEYLLNFLHHFPGHGTRTVRWSNDVTCTILFVQCFVARQFLEVFFFTPQNLCFSHHSIHPRPK